MRRLATIVILMLLAGCTQLAALTPSLQHCSEVKYERLGNQITIAAKCAAPIGGLGL